MSKHFLVSSFENGVSLISRDHHSASLSGLETALKSNLLAGFDVCSMSRPENVKADDRLSGSDDDYWPHRDSWFAAFRPYKVKDGVLIIPVKGVLLHGVSITYGSYMTGYEYIIQAVKRGEADPKVERIVFHIHSPGGHVAGCFDTCDYIWSISKPTVAFIADLAASAGYAIASSCKKVIGTQTVIAGNIGVLVTRVDETDALNQMGVKFHYITAPEGGHKADFHLGNPVTDEMLERLQPEANETYDIFVNCVARGRPMTDAQIRETKALDYRKETSLSMGLIDMVASSVDILAVAQEITFEDPNEIADTMEAAQPEEPEMDLKELESKMDAARKEGAEAASKAATDRIAKILGSEEAEGRGDLAKHFAFSTDLDADSAVAALKVSPKAVTPTDEAAAKIAADEAAKKAEVDEAAKRKAAFDETMSKNSPNLAPNGEGSDGDDDDDAMTKGQKSVNASLALARSMGLAGYGKPN